MPAVGRHRRSVFVEASADERARLPGGTIEDPEIGAGVGMIFRVEQQRAVRRPRSGDLVVGTRQHQLFARQLTGPDAVQIAGAAAIGAEGDPIAQRTPYRREIVTVERHTRQAPPREIVEPQIGRPPAQADHHAAAVRRQPRLFEPVSHDTGRGHGPVAGDADKPPAQRLRRARCVHEDPGGGAIEMRGASRRRGHARHQGTSRPANGERLRIERSRHHRGLSRVEQVAGWHVARVGPVAQNRPGYAVTRHGDDRQRGLIERCGAGVTDRKDHVRAVGQGVRPAMRPLAGIERQRRQHARRAARRRDAREPGGRPGREDDLSPRGPGGPTDLAVHLADRRGRASRHPDLLQAPLREIPDPLAIGREKRVRRSLGAGNGLRLETIDGAHEQLRSPAAGRGVDDKAARRVDDEGAR